MEQNAYATLAPGRHTLEVVFDFTPAEGGFSVCYNFFDAERWKRRHLLGVSDERVRFSLPEMEP